MDWIKGNQPEVAYFIPNGKDISARVPFRCRVISEGGQAFTMNLSGLVDIGTSATITTTATLEMGNQSKVILNGLLYSVLSITPYIPDNVVDGFIKKRLNAEYIVQLG